MKRLFALGLAAVIALSVPFLTFAEEKPANEDEHSATIVGHEVTEKDGEISVDGTVIKMNGVIEIVPIILNGVLQY